MIPSWTTLLQIDLVAAAEKQALLERAHAGRLGPILVLVGWLHLLAFSFCYYLTIVQNYHGSVGYLAIWTSELCLTMLAFRRFGRRLTSRPPRLELFLRRVWIAYLFLAFNLGSLNTLRGHYLFEFFPAIASLASFAFLIMSVTISTRFFGAVLVMFASGLLMAAHLLHAFLIFALAWWLVLNAIGVTLWLEKTEDAVETQSSEQGTRSPE